MTKVQLLEELEALRGSLEPLEAIVEGSRDAIFLSDEWSRFVRVNSAACELTGYSKEELLAMRIPDLHEDMDLDAYRIHHASIMAGQDALTEAEILRKDGTKVPAEFNNRRISVAGAFFLHTVARDITRWKRALEALRESEAMYRRVSDNSPAVLYQFMMTPDGACSFPYVSDLVMAIMGIPPEDVMKDPSTILGMVHPEDQEIVRESIMKSTESLESFPQTFRWMKDGEVIWIEARGTPTPLPDGGVLWDGFLLDITDRKRAEEELRDSRDRLRKLTARLDDVWEEERTSLARELHDEVGQNLTAMRMDLASLEKELPEGREAVANHIRVMIDLAQDSVDRLNRISSELRPPVLEVLGLAAAVESDVWEFRERWGTEIGLELDLGKLEALSERDTTAYRILKESLSNVGLHAQASQVKVSLRVVGEELELEVLDDGTGITDDQLQDHTSFGLIGMRERVERLGGTFDVQRQDEGGTRVRAVIPNAPD